MGALATCRLPQPSPAEPIADGDGERARHRRIGGQAISLLFGRGAEQFRLSGRLSFSAGIFPVWFLFLLAPVIEEIAWHSYGTDALRSRFSLFTSSLIFAAFWAVWHFPLTFIKGYYHSDLLETGLLFSLNFTVSLVPFVLLMNWLYYKTGRSVLAATVFHETAGICNEAFCTHPDSKVIQTALLLALSGVLMAKERTFFFSRAMASTSSRTMSACPSRSEPRIQRPL